MQIIGEAKQESKQRFGLKDLLNVPMQRILKYPLLLKVILQDLCLKNKELRLKAWLPCVRMSFR